MSAAPLPAAPHWIDRASDWLNPILVKETRQSLKSRQFIATFLLMLVAAWLISVFGLLLSGTNIEVSAPGRGFFSAYYIVLAVAIYIVIPFGAFRSLLSERDLQTYEVLSITTLKPRQIVWGKLLSSFVQLFIYYSAITPFIAFTYLLKGIDVPTIAFVLIVGMVASLGVSMAALTVSTVARQRHWQVLLTLIVLGGLSLTFFFSLSMVIGFAMTQGFPFDNEEFWWTLGAVLTFYIGYFGLLLQISVAQLTFDADNRSTGVRLALSSIFALALVWGGILLYQFPGFFDNEVLVAGSVIIVLHLALFGLFAVTEPDVLSRRVRRGLRRFGPFRLVLAPLMPGGGRGLLYVLVHLATLWIFVAGVLHYFGGTIARSGIATQTFISGLCLYLVVYMSIGTALSRWARGVSGDFRPAHARVLTVLLLAVGAILPQLIHFFEFNNSALSALFFITDPFSTLFRLADGHADSGMVLSVLATAAFLGVALNLRALWGGVVEIVAAHVPPPAPRSAPAAATATRERPTVA